MTDKQFKQQADAIAASYRDLLKDAVGQGVYLVITTGDEYRTMIIGDEEEVAGTVAYLVRNLFKTILDQAPDPHQQPYPLAVIIAAFHLLGLVCKMNNKQQQHEAGQTPPDGE